MYAKIINGKIEVYPYSIEQLRKDNPGVSFPDQLSDDLLKEWGVESVNTVSKPTEDHTKNIIAKTPEIIDGSWLQDWIIEDASEEEIQSRVEIAAQNVRDDRDHLLSQSDWTQVQDTPLTVTNKDEWASYRQQLRDISDQQGFPLNINWPVKPSTISKGAISVTAVEQGVTLQ